jgi:hypothetical protein
MKLILCLYILYKTIIKSNEIMELLIYKMKILYYIWIYGMYKIISKN